VGVVAVVVVEGLDGGHFGDALDAPCAPEIEEDDLVVGGQEMPGLAVKGFEDEVAGGLGMELEARRVLVGRDVVLNEFEAQQSDGRGDDDKQG